MFIFRNFRSPPKYMLPNSYETIPLAPNNNKQRTSCTRTRIHLLFFASNSTSWWGQTAYSSTAASKQRDRASIHSNQHLAQRSHVLTQRLYIAMCYCFLWRDFPCTCAKTSFCPKRQYLYATCILLLKSTTTTITNIPEKPTLCGLKQNKLTR